MYPNLLFLNLGSGPQVTEGWISIDASWNAWLAQRPLLRRALAPLLTEHHSSVPWPECGILVHDVRRGLPFDTGSVAGIYAAHFFEHLAPEDAARLAAECFRVLAAGGVLRVVVPDLEALIRDYHHWPERATAASRFLRSLNLAALRRSPPGWRWRLAGLFSRAGHQTVYDRHSLEALLASAGFTAIEARGPLDSRIPQIDRVETAGKHEASVCLEGVKGLVSSSG